MKHTIFREQDGQVLVQVALMIFVLLLFVGLAVDVGNVYAERRAMQNAADAGALAGAREICFGDPANAEAQAFLYAVNLNGADPTMTAVSIVTNMVTVDAGQAAETYFMRLIPGLETIDVSADATAACGEADSACNILPIAFDFDTYDRTEDNDGLECDEAFFVWVDDNWDVETLVDICGGSDPKCLCDPPASAYGGHPMAAGNRGWLRLSEPPAVPEYPNEGDCGFNCGESLKCWMEWLYSGPIHVDDCVPGKPGVTKPVLDVAEKWELGPPVYVLLYDGTCDETIGDCAGDPYFVVGFGCVQVIKVDLQLTWDPLEGYNASDCPKNEKVILVEKRCGCEPSDCGSTAGGPIPEGGIGAVSLIE